MNSLDAYALEFEDMPAKPIWAGRISTKMSQPKTTQAEAPKASKAKYSKTRGEHAKDIVITALIVGIIAFVGGMTFQGKQQDAINTAVKGVQTVAPVATPEVKK